MDDFLDAPPAGSYPDPRVLRLNGLERMDLIHEGRSPAPPTSYLSGLVPTDWAPGRAAFAMPASPWLLIARDLITPGAAALVADAPLGVAHATTLPAGVLTTTSELTVNYLRPIRPGLRLAARASLVDATPYQALIESSVLDADGRMVAHLTSRYVTLRPKVDLDALTGEIPPAEPFDESRALYTRPLPESEIAPVNDELSGLDAFACTLGGEIPPPPVTRLLGMSAPEVSEGRFATTVPASRWFTSPAGTVYGGLTAMLLEVATTGAVMTTLPAGHSCAPLDMKVQYLRPWLPDERRCSLTAEVIHRGRTLGVMRGELRNADGKIVALATGSALVLARPWSDFGSIDAIPVREPKS